MFNKIKERQIEKQAKREQEEREYKEKMLSLTEKEMLFEILLEMKRIEDKLDTIETTIFVHSSN